jgi:mono/diheme cytochrome c family protein
MVRFAKHLVLGASLLGIGAVFAQENLPPGPFTAEQITAGRAAFMASCAACHQASLSG